MSHYLLHAMIYLWMFISQEVRQAAEFLELPQLVVLLSNSNESFLNDETIQHYTAVS